MKWLHTVGIIALCASFAGANVHSNWEEYQNLLQRIGNGTYLGQTWQEHIQQFYVANLRGMMSAGALNDETFKCEPSKSNSTPTSVHRLLPGDIKVVGAIGDSITAGNGILAATPIGVLYQDRGHSFSIGGYESLDNGIITVPNMLRMYNADLYGYSTDGGTVDEDVSMFNMAVPGSTSPAMVEQATSLVEKMQRDSKVNYDLDWKLVTLFVGGNDLCWVCDDEDNLGTDAFITNIKAALDILSSRMPRTLVNVMPIMDVTPLLNLSDGPICDAIQNVICPCGTDPNKRTRIQQIQKEYASYTQSLIDAGIYDKDDFTVVFQPFLRDTKPPTDDKGKPDLSYFAPDCFHFSEKGHKALARNLWNSMFQPVKAKQTSITFNEAIKCPAKGQFIQTVKLSKQADSAQSPVAEVLAAAGPVTGKTAVGPAAAGLVVVAGIVGALCGLLVIVGAVILINKVRQRVRVRELVI